MSDLHCETCYGKGFVKVGPYNEPEPCPNHDLRASIALLADGDLLNRISRHDADVFVVSVATVAAAARLVAEAPEWTICEVHNSRILDWSVCETSARMASQMQYLAPCRMVRKLLVDPEEET